MSKGKYGAHPPIGAPFIDTICPLPINVIGGDGASVITEDGEALLDFWTDTGTVSLGYGPGVLDFITKKDILQLPFMYGNELRRNAASRLVEAMGMDRVFFANSGTEANEAAIKMARLYHHKRGEGERKFILTMEGNFHGRTGFSLAATDTTSAKYYVEGMGPMPECFGVMRWKDVLEESGRFDDFPIAAVICAPILGVNLVDTEPLFHLSQLREWCDKRGALLILDEVQSGSGRTGLPAAWQHVNEKPDIMTLAKGLAAGMPLSACLAQGPVADTFKPGEHFNTFGGNLICLQAMIAVLDLITTDEFFNRAVRYDQMVTRRLFAIPWIESVHGMGFHQSFQPDWEVLGMDGFQLCDALRQKGLLVVTHRQHGQIRFLPPLTVTTEELGRALGALESVAG